MEDTPVFRRPWFYIAGWLFFLVALYGWQVYRLWNEQSELLNVLFELVCLFPAFLLLWVAFFSQFVLPVQTFEQRQKIFDRLLSYLFGSHGPALFIKNGVIQEHAGERLKKGPGVVWLDSASAALTRTSTKIKQTLGPGVHFLANGEYITATLDLHTQFEKLGPRDTDDPFAPGEDSTPEYREVQDRRRQVSAWTRDGIEVIPNISITFRVDTGLPEPGKPGSRFGYRTGITREDRENQKQDLEAIKKALLGEGINPNISTDSPLHKVAWNQLPAQVAVDVWREYAAKFTLDEFFAPTQDVPPPPPPPLQPTSSEIASLNDPTQFTAHQNRLEDALTAMLHEINRLMERIIQWLDGQKQVEPPKHPAPQPTPAPQAPTSLETQKKTALQVINEVVTARLTKTEVPSLDNQGKRSFGLYPSREFEILKNRGLKILSVSISPPRTHPNINNLMIERWNANWAKTVDDEKNQIESQHALQAAAGHDQAIVDYAMHLSKDLLKRVPPTTSETLKNLVRRSRLIAFKYPQLRSKLMDDQDTFEEIIKWIDTGG
jgi:hypothetical protein